MTAESYCWDFCGLFYRDVGVVFDLVGDSGFRAMPRINNGLRRKRKDFLANSLEEQRAISSRQIPAPYPLVEEDIPADELAGFWKVKTETPRTMPRNVKGGKIQSRDVVYAALLQQAVGLNRLHIDIKAMPLKKISISHHWDSVGMKCDFASMAALDQRGIRDMIKVAVGEQKPIDLIIRKVRIRALRSVEEDISLRRLNQKGVSEKRSACKFFELNHAMCCLLTNVEI